LPGPDKDSGSGTSGKSEGEYDQGQVSGNLYKGWMAGYAYRACSDLYFGKGLPKLEPADRLVLLEWLLTYGNVLNDLSASGTDAIAKGLAAMAADVSSGKDTQSVNVGDFDAWFAEVAGALRAKMPYAFPAAKFGRDTDALNHTPVGSDVSGLCDDLLDSLQGLKNALPHGVFSVISHDISDLASRPFADVAVRPAGKKRHARVWYVTKTWSELILGTITVRDALNQTGRTLYYAAVGGVAIGLFSVVGLVMVLPFLIVPAILNVPLSSLSLTTGKDLFTTIQTLVGTLSAVGLSISLLASKAWNGMKSFEPWMAVRLARRKWARREESPPKRPSAGGSEQKLHMV
jgi:hypothetical protein